MERIIITPSLESAQLGLRGTTHYLQVQLFIQLVYSIFHIIEQINSFKPGASRGECHSLLKFACSMKFKLPGWAFLEKYLLLPYT